MCSGRRGEARLMIGAREEKKTEREREIFLRKIICGDEESRKSFKRELW